MFCRVYCESAMPARAGYNSLWAMFKAAPLALLPSHATRVSGLLRAAKSTSSAREYSFVASTENRESRKTFACSRISLSAEKGQGRFGEGGTSCADALREIASVTIRRTGHRQVMLFTVLLSYQSAAGGGCTPPCEDLWSRSIGDARVVEHGVPKRTVPPERGAA